MGILGCDQRKSDETAVVSLCPPRARILCPSTLRAPRDLIPFGECRSLKCPGPCDDICCNVPDEFVTVPMDPFEWVPVF